jgi:hypothetical protein
MVIQNFQMGYEQEINASMDIALNSNQGPPCQ